MRQNLPETVIEAVQRLTSAFRDDTHPAMREVRLFVMNEHEMLSGMLDSILLELLVSRLPIPEGADPSPFVAHMEGQVRQWLFA